MPASRDTAQRPLTFAPSILRSLLLPVILGLATACTPEPPALRAFSLDDAPRLRQPAHVAFPSNGQRLSYLLGDSLWVQELGEGTPQPPRPVLGDVASEAAYLIPFLAWSGDGRRLVMRSGNGGPGEGDGRQGTPFLVELGDSVMAEPLLPDSLRRRISTFRDILTPRPAWSPDGRRLAFVGWDRGSPDSGEVATIFIHDAVSGSLTRLATDERNKRGLAWSPDGRWLAYTTGDFVGSSGSVVIVDASNLEDVRSTHAGGAGLYRAPRWSPDSGSLLVVDRLARPTLLRVDETGAMTERATTLPARSYAGFLEGDGTLLATVRSGMSARLARVDLESGVETLLSGPDSLTGALGVVGSGADRRILFSLESGDTPLDVWSAPLSPDGTLGQRRRVTRANAWLDSVELAEAYVRRWTADNGEELEAQVLSPRSPGPHPLVVLPYGAYVNEFPRGEYFMSHGIQALVARGFVVARPNTRGVASGSQDDGRYGEVQLADTRALIRSLADEGVVDTARVALLGHSHGAAMVYYYLSHSNAFRGGVAVNGAADWVFQAGLSTMVGLPVGMGGTPEELPEHYAAFSPLANAARVNAPLLAVTGGLDRQIPERNASSMVDSLRALGREARWISFPDEGHLIRDPSNVRRLWEEILLFVEAVTVPRDPMEGGA